MEAGMVADSLPVIYLENVFPVLSLLASGRSEVPQGTQQESHKLQLPPGLFRLRLPSDPQTGNAVPT